MTMNGWKHNKEIRITQLTNKNKIHSDIRNIISIRKYTIDVETKSIPTKDIRARLTVIIDMEDVGFKEKKLWSLTCDVSK